MEEESSYRARGLGAIEDSEAFLRFRFSGSSPRHGFGSSGGPAFLIHYMFGLLLGGRKSS